MLDFVYPRSCWRQTYLGNDVEDPAGRLGGVVFEEEMPLALWPAMLEASRAAGPDVVARPPFSTAPPFHATRRDATLEPPRTVFSQVGGQARYPLSSAPLHPAPSRKGTPAGHGQW